MMKTLLRLFALLLIPLLGSLSCQRFQQKAIAPSSNADSLIEAAHLSHDSDRIIFLADSLEAAGALGPIEADYWRGYGHFGKWDLLSSRQYWYEAMSHEIISHEDVVFYGRAANRLADGLLTSGEYEASMRVAIPAMEKMRQEGTDISRDYAYLLVVVGCCELNNQDFQEADDRFNEAYKLFMLLVADNGEDGGSSHEDNLKTTVAGLTTIARHCMEKNRFAEVLVWTDRQESVMEEYARQPETIQASLDRRQTLSGFFRASALEGLGSHAAATEAFEAALRNPFATTPQGRIEAARYLMMAGRWEEAADNYRQLDRVAATFGAGLTLDNIQQYLLPKLRANLNSHRNEEAMAASIQLCNSLDSAIIRNRRDKAAELATLYRTQEIKQDFLQQKANLERERFRSSLAVLVILIIGFLLFVFLRYRSSIRLEEAYQKLEVANAHAQEASRVKTAFLQQISHEVRTPINLISGFAQLLTTPGMELDEQSRQEINTGVVQNTFRITSLINKILELSDLVSTPVLAKKDRVAVWQLTSQAADISGIRRHTGIAFEIRMADETRDLELQTNEKAVTRILGLLLENAAKFTEKGSVTLRVVPKQSYLCFLVEDTGIGVPPEDAERIFEHFVQLDDYREGTGTGLTLARSLSRRLGGDVILDTSYTSGARFIFSTPLNAG